MTALSLFNRNLNNFESSLTAPFFSANWLKDYSEPRLLAAYNDSNEMKFNEKTSAWELTQEIAGVSKEKLKVDAKEGHLVISGEKTRGLSQGPFEKYFKIPDDVDIDRIEALFEDSVLTVTLPVEITKAMKTIQIK
jgi:HSP20 family molecular chaperone IbpA